jgi:hypothetical protein
MKKVFAIVLVSVFAFAMVACGDDDSGSSVDNVAACNDLVDTLNGLDCASGYDWGIDCNLYSADSYPCDIAEYFNCLSDATTCTATDPSYPDLSGWGDCTVPTC